MDPSILYSSPKTIREEVDRILSDFGKQNGHVFNLGHGIAPGVNPDHVKFLLTQFMKLQPSITFDESDTLISIVGLGSNQDSRNGSKFEIICKAINSLEELPFRARVLFPIFL